MKTILAAMFAVMIGLSFAGSTFADEKKTDAPAGEVKKDESKKTETKTETKTDTKNGKESKKKSTKTTEEKTEKTKP
jgi:uncharacterized protein YxeA